MKTKVHKVTLLIVDHDNVGPEEIKILIEDQRYPNYCITPEVKKIETQEVFWTDDHPLNHKDVSEEAYKELFK